MFWNILSMEIEKTFKRRLFWIGLIVLALFIMFVHIMLYAFRGGLPPAVTQFLIWPAGLVYGLDYAAGYVSSTSYGIYLLIVLVGTVMAQEYSWRTLQLWLSHGVARPLLLGAKLTLSLAPALLIVFVCLLITGGLTAFFSLQSHGAVYVNRVDYVQLALSCLRTMYAMLPYAALTFMLAVISRSAVVAVGGGLAFLAIVETALNILLPLLGQNFARLSQYLPSGLSSALNSQNYALAKIAIPPSALQPSPIAAIIGIALYTLLFYGIALWVFQRQDLTN